MARSLAASLAPMSVLNNDDLREPELHVVGEILGGSGFQMDNAFCLYEMKTGKQWLCVGGDESGQTQIDYPEEDDAAGGMFVWNHPLDLHYYTKTMEGWPKMVFEVWSLNDVGAKILSGYGFCNIPSSPGSHELDVSVWRPCGSAKEEIYGFFLDSVPQLMNIELLYNPSKAKEERNRIFTTAVGKIHLRIDVMLRHLADHSVSVK